MLLATIGGCRGDGEDRPPPSPPDTSTPVPATGALTPSSPALRLHPTASGSPEVLELQFGPVGNPTRAGFSVRVQLETVDGASSTYELGRVSTFPPDAPGVFALRLPDAAVRDLTTGRRSPAVVLRLEPVAPDMPLPPSLRLVVGRATLRAA